MVSFKLLSLIPDIFNKQVISRQMKISNFRWFIFVLSHTAKFVLNSSKSCLGLAIVAMMNRKITSATYEDNVQIDSILSNSHVDWSETQKDRMLQAVSWGSLVIALFGGRIGEVFGPRKVMTAALLTNGIVNLIFPALSLKSFWGAMIARIIIGIAGGISSPTFYVIISRWSCAYELTLSISIVTCGHVTANIFVHPFIGFLATNDSLGGWPSVFYIIGALNILVAFLWYIMVYDSPEEHPMLSPIEKDKILQNRSLKSIKTEKVPWTKLLTSLPVLAYLTIPFTYDWLEYVVSIQMPSYYENILHMSYKNNGLFNSIPWILSFSAALLASFVADKLIRTKRFSLTFIRKMFTLLALGGASFWFFLITQFSTNNAAVISFVTLSKGMGAMAVAGAVSSHLDICPSYAGTLSGFNVIITSLSALAMNEAAALIIGDEPTREKWNTFFYLTATLNLIGVILFLLFGSGNVESWDPSYQKSCQIIEENGNESEKRTNAKNDSEFCI